MEKAKFSKTYIREWRRKRGYSLRKLEGMLETEPGGEPLISYASIGRIETGEQPYSQPIIEALADALRVTVADLLEVNPEKEGDVVDLLRHLKGDKREEAIRYLKYLAAG